MTVLVSVLKVKRRTTILLCVLGDTAMLYFHVLLLLTVFFVVTLMFNPLFWPLSSLFSKKYGLGMLLRHFLVKVRLAFEKPGPRGPFALFCTLGFFNLRNWPSHSK
uniref:Uncharacterized protein n=1 Tax=Opuntia streptacantha TaxID=393608 RepID=A0A7C8ZEA4_OPUST